MASKQLWQHRSLKLYVHGNSNTSRDEIWYSIDFDSLAEEPVKPFYPVFGAKTSRTKGAWTVMGDDIYYACISNPDEIYAPVVFAKHSLNKSTDDPYSLDVVCDDLERRLIGLPNLIPLDGNKILLLGVKKSVFFHEDDEDACDDHFMAEVMDLNTRIWNDCAYNLQMFVADFYYFHKTTLRDEQGKVKQIVFYSFTKGMFVFYDVYEDKFCLEKHTKFVLDQLPCDRDHISYIHTLSKVIMNTTAALMGSTLYWFTHEFCLYGYDFRLRTWFQSPPIEKDKLWEIPERPLACPFLVDAYNGNELILIVMTRCAKLGIAFLSVSKLGNSLDVSVTARHVLCVDPKFLPRDGLTMISAATLKTPGPDADSVSSPIPDGSAKVVCRCSPWSPVMEMNREAQLVDISNENKAMSLHVEQMQSVYREFALVSQLMESQSMVGVLRTYLSDTERDLQNLSEENELLKLEMKNMGSGSSKISNEALIKLGDSTRAEDQSSRSLACVIEELNAAVAANSEIEELNAAVAANSAIETELRRLKSQRDQWRKAAEAMVSLLSTGNNKKKYNMWKVSTLSIGNNRKNYDSLKKIGSLLKKGQK